MNKMVMIIPIDCQIDEAQYVADEIRSHASEDLPTGAVRHLQLEDHDRDDDGDHAVAERCETIFPHGCDLTSYHIVVGKAELCIDALSPECRRRRFCYILVERPYLFQTDGRAVHFFLDLATLRFRTIQPRLRTGGGRREILHAAKLPLR